MSEITEISPKIRNLPKIRNVRYDRNVRKSAECPKCRKCPVCGFCQEMSDLSILGLYGAYVKNVNIQGSIGSIRISRKSMIYETDDMRRKIRLFALESTIELF